MIDLTYFGNAVFGIRSADVTVLIDPYITESEQFQPGLDAVFDSLGSIDVVCVTHIGYDHLGDTLTLARDYEIPVITEPATAHYLREHGVPDDRITVLVWGIRATIHDMTIRAIEAHHLSIDVVNDNLVSGLPLGFLLSDGDTSIYHVGDTSIFSDLKLFGDVYEPDVTLLGVGQAHVEDGPDEEITRVISELTTEEAVMVAEWIGSETVIPMHYIPEKKEREAFIQAMDDIDRPTVVSLDPGDSLNLQ